MNTNDKDSGSLKNESVHPYEDWLLMESNNPKFKTYYPKHAKHAEELSKLIGREVVFSLMEDVDLEDGLEPEMFHYAPCVEDGKILFTRHHLDTMDDETFNFFLGHEVGHLSNDEHPRKFITKVNGYINFLAPPISAVATVGAAIVDAYSGGGTTKIALLASTALVPVALAVKTAMAKIVNRSEVRADKFEYKHIGVKAEKAIEYVKGNPRIIEIGEAIKGQYSFIQRLDNKYFSGYDDAVARTKKQCDDVVPETSIYFERLVGARDASSLEK